MAKRVSVLAATLRALGAKMGEWNDMELPFAYLTDPDDEHDAIRDAIGIWDTSGLRKIHVRGPDALATVDHLATRNMTKIYVGKSAYSPILKDDGDFCDDSYIYHIDEDEFLVAHGTGPTLERIQDSAQGKNVSIEFDEDLHAISVQGPKSIELLDAHTPVDLYGLKFCHQVDTTLFGKNLMIARTGFSGERGYEIFVPAEDAVEVWEQLMAHGKPLGLMPASFAGIDKVHIESALLFYDAEATEENTPWEVNCGWAISRTKGDFRGKAALFALEGKEKVKLCGIVAEHGAAVEPGAALLVDGENVGRITSAAYSRRLGQSLALVHLAPSAAREGTQLEVKGPNVQCGATVARIPFVDPERKRLHGM
jgi:aminomethyltransferase